MNPLHELPENTPFVLLDDGSVTESTSLLYTDLETEVSCHDPDGVADAMAAIEAANARGLYAAGYIAYEAGYCIEPHLARLLPADRPGPLLWFGLFRNKTRLTGTAETERALIELTGLGGDAFAVTHLERGIDRDRYIGDIKRIRDYIRAGDVYQVNYTYPLTFKLSGDPLRFYLSLRRKQRAGHGAVIWHPEFSILSLSPELFVEIAGERVVTRPMKGTAPRGTYPDRDRAVAEDLKDDPKSQAENLMIVDLLRNDLSRISTAGSVNVDALFTLETYPTFHTLTSTISASLTGRTSAAALAMEIFPCGSVTGAPKIRAMEIIRELEDTARGVYTGSIGSFEPGGQVKLNVAIRTIHLDGAGQGTMGIGSGIVFDSDPEAEYEECLLKARFLTDPPLGFSLFESILWKPGSGYWLLDYHLQRLAASAEYFRFRYDAAAIGAALEAAAETLDTQPMKVRIVTDAEGQIWTNAAPLGDDMQGPWRFVLSSHAADSRDVFFYHKTDNRAFYEDELVTQRQLHGVTEVLFQNEHGALTEGCRSNFFVLRDGVLHTPPVASGLLAGVLRQHMLEHGWELDGRPVPVIETVLTPRDLETAEALFFGNSVRGLVRADYLGPAGSGLKGQSGVALGTGR